MTRYVLPAILGGKELDGEAHGDGVILGVPGYGHLLIPAHYLTKVTPSLPPEPADGYYLDRQGDVWCRTDEEPYLWMYGTLVHNWEDLNDRFGPLTRLIPDPADAAPALPWDVEDNDDDSLVIQDADAKGIAAMVSVNNESVYLTPAVAREAAGVLLRAARDFEEREAGAAASETAGTPTGGAEG